MLQGSSLALMRLSIYHISPVHIFKARTLNLHPTSKFTTLSLHLMYNLRFHPSTVWLILVQIRMPLLLLGSDAESREEAGIEIGCSSVVS